jgi:oligopeptide/dipeptide ABC transporter ATP-binding protein
VIENPKHPYVKMLIESIPVPDPNQKWDTNVTLPSEEELRSQVDTGCRFYPRCPYHMDRCLVKQPPLYEIDSGTHRAACYLYDQSLAEPSPVEWNSRKSPAPDEPNPLQLTQSNPFRAFAR